MRAARDQARALRPETLRDPQSRCDVGTRLRDAPDAHEVPRCPTSKDDRWQATGILRGSTPCWTEATLDSTAARFGRSDSGWITRCHRGLSTVWPGGGMES